MRIEAKERFNSEEPRIKSSISFDDESFLKI